MKINLAVIFGGQSVEHEISIITAVQAMENVNREKYNVFPIYISKNNEFYFNEKMTDITFFKDLNNACAQSSLISFNSDKNKNYMTVHQKSIFKKNKKQSIDCVLVCVHGTNVEDGSLAGFLEMHNLPYSSSRVAAGGIGQDKIFMKDILKANHLPVIEYFAFLKEQYLNDEKSIIKEIEKIKYPVIIKPANLGSSIGINGANNLDELKEAIEVAITFDQKVVVEKMLTNITELNIAVLGDQNNAQVSAIEKVNASNDFLSYADKYESNQKGKTNQSQGMASLAREVPAKIDTKQKQAIEQLALQAFHVLGQTGVIRIDLIIDEQNNIYINEINNVPGSLAYYLFEPIGKTYAQLIDELVNISYRQKELKNKTTYTIATNVLKNQNKFTNKLKS